MKERDDYWIEHYKFNSFPFVPEEQRIQLYAYCDSEWKAGYKVRVSNSATNYALYSLTLDGELESTELDSGEHILNRANDFWIIPSIEKRTMRHRIGKNAPFLRKFILVHRNSFHDMICSRMFPDGKMLFRLPQPERAENVLDSIKTAMTDPHVDNAKLSGLFFQLLHEVRSQHTEQRFPPGFSKAVEFIRENYRSRSISCSAIASEAGVSVRTLTNLFSSVQHIPVFRYVIDLRLEEVCRLLAFTDLRVNEIAEKCGFSASNFMAREFRKKYGKSPGAYRKEHSVVLNKF